MFVIQWLPVSRLYRNYRINECAESGGMRIGKGNKYWEKIYPSATQSTTNPT
jgi:hypothetical protein